MTNANIQRIAFLFQYFFHTKLIYSKAARLASLLPQPPLHTPPASAAPLPRKLPTMCLVPRRPSEKETLVWRLLASFVPPSQVYIYIYIYIERNVIEDVKGNSEVGGFWGTVLVIGIVRIGQSSSSERHSFGGFEQKVRRSKVCSRVRVASLCCRP